MTTGLLFDCDQQVAAFAFSGCRRKQMPFDRALGLLNKDAILVGGVIFQNWNGSNVELSYYGANTLTPGIIKLLARFIIACFDVARVTVTVSKREKRLMRALGRIGFKLEGVQRCYYGRHDTIRNTGVRFVMFRVRLEQLARFNSHDEARKTC